MAPSCGVREFSVLVSVLWVQSSAATAGPRHAQQDGLKLPEVDAVLTKATSKMGIFKDQTEAIKASVTAKQMEKEHSMFQRKKDLEDQLRQQEQQNIAVADKNNDIAHEIKMLRTRDRELRKDLVQLSNANTMIRETISDLRGKMIMAADFLGDTLRTTDDVSRATDTVLKTSDTSPPSLAKFLKMAEGVGPHINDQRKPVRLIQYRTLPTVVEQSEGFAQHLSKSFAEMVDAEIEGEAMLEQEFQRLFQQEVKEYQRLQGEQKKMLGTRDNLKDQVAQLEVAKTHGLNLQEELRQRLHGVRIFVRKVDAESVETYNAVDSMLDVKGLPSVDANDSFATAVVAEAAVSATVPSAFKGSKKEKRPVSVGANPSIAGMTANATAN